MKTYDFTLKFAVPPGLTRGALEDLLYEAGCDDALIGSGKVGRLAVAFAREAGSANQAISSALADTQKALPEARLIEVSPDLVGVSDIAEFFSFSRQNMRKLLQVHQDSFPLPLHEGRASLWHLAEVLEWFERHHRQNVDISLSEVAEASMRANLNRELRRLPGGKSDRLDQGQVI